MTFKYALKKAGLLLLPALVVLGASAPVQAAQPLRMVVGTMAYPLEVFDEQGQLSGGLFKELGEHLAREMHTRPDFVRLPRRRVEPALLAGEADIFCYHSPRWSENPKTLRWTLPSLYQIERVVVPTSRQPPVKIPDDFVGKRVSTRLGYHYAAIQPLFDAGRAYRLDETQTAFMFKAVQTGHTDMLISSDSEIAGYFEKHPQARQHFAIAAHAFSSMPTQCAVSPTSRWSVAKLNRALSTLLQRGDIARMGQRYGLPLP